MEAFRGVLLALALSAVAYAQALPPEQFDLSGLPPQPTSFLEQQIRQAVSAHRAGDLGDAQRIQTKLAEYYAEHGDAARAETARTRAQSAQALTDGATQSASATSVAPQASTSSPNAAAPRPKPSGFRGSFYRTDPSGTLHTWDFLDDGTYLYRTIARGVGTSAGTSERGTFRVEGHTLILQPTRSTSAFVTPGTRGTQLGAGTGATPPARKMTFKLVGAAVRLDGKLFKAKIW